MMTIEEMHKKEKEGVEFDDFYKENKKDKIWWSGIVGDKGDCFLFTFDKKKIYELFADYPKALTKEEKAIFDKENPYWADFFAYRT